LTQLLARFGLDRFPLSQAAPRHGQSAARRSGPLLLLSSLYPDPTRAVWLGGSAAQGPRSEGEGGFPISAPPIRESRHPIDVGSGRPRSPGSQCGWERTTLPLGQVSGTRRRAGATGLGSAGIFCQQVGAACPRHCCIGEAVTQAADVGGSGRRGLAFGLAIR